jgi:hypothetical protein
MEQNKKNTTPEQDAQEKTKGGSALAAAGVARSATAQVDPHSNSGLANTGTNISYDGATAPGAGGSVGTGYASGKEATGETLTTDSDYAQGRGGSPNKPTNAVEPADTEDDLDDDELDDEDLDDADIDDEELDEDMDDEDETQELK